MSSDDGAASVVDAGAGSGLVGLRGLIDAVNGLDPHQPEGVLVEQIGALERLKAACAAAQARLTHAFAAAHTADAAARHRDPGTTRRSIAAQLALTRRDARSRRGQRHVGAARALVTEMPHTMAALECGEITERRARIIIEQFACLTPTGRAHADTVIAAELPGLGDRAAQSRAAGIAYRLDPEAVMGKIRGAVTDRHVSLRPAPDTMTRLSALLPVAQGVAVYAALRRSADTATAAGDARTRGQVMADELTSRITGHTITGCDPYGAPHYETTDAANDEPGTTAPPGGATTVAGGTTGRPARTAGTGGGLEVNLIMTDRTLLGEDDEPAQLLGHGPIPAQLARSLVIGNADTATTTWVRRLYTDPTGTQLVAMDSRRRLFPAAAQKFLILRDQTCRTPWCDAPIRHIDHITPFGRGGPTHLSNGQGLCQACNLSKQAPHWRSWTDPHNTDNPDNTDDTVHITTPTGHHYTSNPPPPPKSQPWPDISTIEHHLALELLYTA